MFLFNLMAKPYLFYGEYLVRARLFEQNRDRHFFCYDHRTTNHCHKFLPKFNVDSVLNVTKAVLTKKFVQFKPTRFDRFQKVKIYKKKKNYHDKKMKDRPKINSLSFTDSRKKKNSFINQGNFCFISNKDKLSYNADKSEFREKKNSLLVEEKIENFDSILEEPSENLRKIMSSHSLNFKISSESIKNQYKKSSFSFIQDNSELDKSFEKLEEPEIFFEPQAPSCPKSNSSSISQHSIRKTSFSSIISNKQSKEDFLQKEKKSFLESLSQETSVDRSYRLSTKTNKSNNLNEKPVIEHDVEVKQVLKKNSILSKNSINNFDSPSGRPSAKIEIVELIKLDSKSKILIKKSNLTSDKEIESKKDSGVKIREKQNKNDDFKNENIENLKDVSDLKNSSSKSEMRKSKISILRPGLSEAVINDQVGNSEKKKKSLARLIKALSKEQEENKIEINKEENESTKNEKNIFFKDREVERKKSNKIDNFVELNDKEKEEEKESESKKYSKNVMLENKSSEKNLIKNIDSFQDISENKKLTDEFNKATKEENGDNKIRIENKFEKKKSSENSKKPDRFIPKNFFLNFDLNITRAFTFSYFTLPKHYENLNRKIYLFEQNYDLIKRFVKNNKTKSLSQSKDKFKNDEELVTFFEEYFKKLSPSKNKLSPIRVEAEIINILNSMLDDILNNLKYYDDSFTYGNICQSENLINNQLVVV